MAQMSFDRSHPLYQEDLKQIAEKIHKESVVGKSFMITGATGLLGTLLIDTLMWMNINLDSDIKIYALGRSQKRMKDRFSEYWDDDRFEFHEYDATKEAPFIKTDFIIHCAGSSHPKLFAEDPVGTLMGNIIGTNGVLEVARKSGAISLILSSGEIYGDNTEGLCKMDENFQGKLSLNNSRSCYSEGKRAVESLCQSYLAQYGMSIKIARPCRIFGPTMTTADNKASAQFLKSARQGKDIVLKSSGEQMFSYIYGADAVSALLTILLKGENGVPYNVSDDRSDVRLRDFAATISDIANVGFEIVSTGEAGGSKVQNAILDNSRLKSLGWNSPRDIKSNIRRTLVILN